MGLLDGLEEKAKQTQNEKENMLRTVDCVMSSEDIEQCVKKIVEVTDLKKKISNLKMEVGGGFFTNYFYRFSFEADVYLIDGSNQTYKDWLSKKNGIAYSTSSFNDICLYFADVRQVVDLFNGLIKYFGENKIITYKEKPIIYKNYYQTFGHKERAYIKRHFKMEEFGVNKKMKFVIHSNIQCDKNGKIT